MNNSYNYLAQFYDELMEMNYSNWISYLTSFFDEDDKDILDLGCGTAQISNLFYQKGYDVVAVDSSIPMLNIAWNNYGDKFTILNQDIKELDIGKKFDVVISTCDVMNYFLEETDLSNVFKSIKSHLHPNGKFLFDISSAYKIENILAGNTFSEETEDQTYIWHNFYSDKILQMDLIFFVYDKNKQCYQRFDEKHFQRAWHKEEVTKILKKAGFTVESIFECFTNNSPKKLSDRIFFSTRYNK